MIKNTNSSCIIKDISVSSINASVVVIITSQLDQKINLPFKFYLQDFDSNDLISLSDTTYYIDRVAGWVGESSVVNVNKYAMIHFTIDITNNNTSEIRDLRWYRKCRFVLKNMMDLSIAWRSEWIELLSKEVNIPTVTNLNMYTLLNSNEEYVSTIKLKYEYKEDQDFNYNNEYLYTIINMYSQVTGNLIETARIDDENYLTSSISYTFAAHVTDKVYVEIALLTTNNTVLYKKIFYYTPAITMSNSWYIDKGVPKKVKHIYAIY